MFVCEKCKKVTKPKEKQFKKIVKTRDKTYQYIDKKGKEVIKTGREIVKEINICEECMHKLNKVGE